jgi:hypothetical protein
MSRTVFDGVSVGARAGDRGKQETGVVVQAVDHPGRLASAESELGGVDLPKGRSPTPARNAAFPSPAAAAEARRGGCASARDGSSRRQAAPRPRRAGESATGATRLEPGRALRLIPPGSGRSSRARSRAARTPRRSTLWCARARAAPAASAPSSTPPSRPSAPPGPLASASEGKAQDEIGRNCGVSVEPRTSQIYRERLLQMCRQRSVADVPGPNNTRQAPAISGLLAGRI